jgi:hypothetical protein
VELAAWLPQAASTTAADTATTNERRRITCL